MKTLSYALSVILFILNVSYSASQNTTKYESLKSNLEKPKQPKIKTECEIPYDELLDREFTKILTGQNTNFGPFAALGTKDDIASLSGNIPICGKSNLGINVKGGVTEGIVSLLNGEKVNSNISLGLQFNQGIYSHINITDATQELNFKAMCDSLTQEVDKTIRAIDFYRNKKELEIRQKELQLKQKTRDLKKLNEYKPTLSGLGKEQKEIKTDSIEVLILTLKNDTVQLKNDILYLNHQLNQLTDDMLSREKQNIKESMVKKYKKELQKLPLIGYKLKWVSFTINFNNRTFYLFDASSDYDNQINKSTFNRLELGVYHNKYQLKNQFLGTYYYSIGVSYLIDDNFDELSKTTINDKQEISSPPLSRAIEKTKTVYVGEYQSGISKLKFDYNSYWFLTYNQSIALHLNPSAGTDFKLNWKFDFLAGFLVGFKNQEKENSVINAELFYNMKDVFKKSENEEDKFVDRAALGIKLNFPIYSNQKL